MPIVLTFYPSALSRKRSVLVVALALTISLQMKFVPVTCASRIKSNTHARLKLRTHLANPHLSLHSCQHKIVNFNAVSAFVQLFIHFLETT